MFIQSSLGSSFEACTIIYNIHIITPPTAELAALEGLKNPHRLIMGKGMSQLFLGCSRSDPFHTCR